MAKKYGYAKSGCYYLDLLEHSVDRYHDKRTFVAASPDKVQVLRAAIIYDLPWGKYSMYDSVVGWKNEV
jgi:hypothetical protein